MPTSRVQRTPPNTLTGNDQGKTIKVKVTFNDDKGNGETLTIVAASDVDESEQKPQFLVSNLGVGVGGAAGIHAPAWRRSIRVCPGVHDGHEDRRLRTRCRRHPGFALFRWVDRGGPPPGDDQRRRERRRAGRRALHHDQSVELLGAGRRSPFEAPAGGGSCPQLAAETTYFVVIEWVSPSGIGTFALIPQTYPTEESAASGEDPGGAEGWSIADESYYLAVSSDARTWTAYDETASFKIKVKESAVTAAKANSPATGAPTISGTPQVGETLTADTSAITDEDGLDDVSYSYQWIVNDGTEDADIEDATDSTYIPLVNDVGNTIKVKVSFTDDADNDETLTGAATEAVAAKPNSEPTGFPAIIGTPQVGETLTADTSAISDEDGQTTASYSYQWIAGGSDIAGATGSSYTLTSSEQGQTVQVRVTFTDDADNAESLTSVATETVAQTPSLLTVSLENAATSHNGTDVFTFEIRFSEQFGLSYKALRDHAFTVVGGEVKKAQRMDRDSDTPNIRWLITVEPDSGGDVAITLPVTTDCTDDGAHCTEDGRMLSNSLVFSASGPSQ